MDLNALIQNIPYNHILLAIVLVVIGLWLKSYDPPIKKQYQFLLLAIIGVILGLLMISNCYIGFAISGLVYYKEELVDELKTIRKAAIDIEKLKDLNKKGE
jgi:amino acid transporter